MTKKPILTLVGLAGNVARPPPRKLGKHGRALWDRIQAAYEITDAGGVEMLAQICEQAERAEQCRIEIDRDGEVLRCKGGLKEHPLLKIELASRSFVVRGLQKLGLDLEPVRSRSGRPGIAFGWEGPRHDD